MEEVMLTQQEQERYSRQTMLPEIGAEGQRRLKNAKVLIIGAGGLGSPAAMYLAAAGVGALGICDSDIVVLSNLQRQILHGTRDLGQKKVISAGKTLADINPDIQIVTYDCRAEADNIQELIAGYSFVLDCTDSYASKFLINDACVKARKAFCHAGVAEFGGQLMTWVPGINVPGTSVPCLRCIFPKIPPAAPKQGIVGAVAGVIGSLQAMEAVKYITGAGQLFTGAILTYNALEGGFRRVSLPNAAQECPVLCAGGMRAAPTVY